MLGLIEKDLRLTLSRKQTVVIFFVLALVMGFSMDGSFLVGYLTMLASILAVGTISYDEYDNGFAFLMTLPFDRKTYVLEKYLFSLLMSAGAWLIGVILSCILGAVKSSPLYILTDLPVLLTLIPLLYLSAAIMIPLQLKYGAEKSRIALFVIFGIIAILIMAVNRFADNEAIYNKLSVALDSVHPLAILAGITAVCVILSVLSYFISVRIMEKKEF